MLWDVWGEDPDDELPAAGARGTQSVSAELGRLEIDFELEADRPRLCECFDAHSELAEVRDRLPDLEGRRPHDERRSVNLDPVGFEGRLEAVQDQNVALAGAEVDDPVGNRPQCLGREDEVVRARPAFEVVASGPAEEYVVARSPLDVVIASSSRQPIISSKAAEPICSRRPLDSICFLRRCGARLKDGGGARCKTCDQREDDAPQARDSLPPASRAPARESSSWIASSCDST